MAETVLIPFARHSYQARSKNLSGQRLVNLYAEKAPDDAKVPISLIGTPGLKPFVTVGNGPLRGLHVAGSYLYAVSGSEVYRVDSTGDALKLGNISASFGQAVLFDNGTQIGIIDSNNDAYVATSTTLTRITDPDFPGATSGDFVDGYGLFVQPDTDTFFISALSDFSDIDGADFAAAESSPDNIVRVIVDHREVWLFGTDTTEIWYNSGNNAFPFERINGVSIERGCAAKLSVAKMDNTLYWLGDDKVVYRSDGYNPVRISTHAIEAAIGKYSEVSDATAFSYTQDGHKFYCLRFPTIGATWVFDISTGLWHERESYGHNNWLANCHAFAFNKNLVGSSMTGDIYELDLDTYTDNGTTIQRMATGAVLWDQTRRFITDAFELDIETGVGLPEGQGSEPLVVMDFSDDGGATWSTGDTRSLGKIGRRETRAVWRRLGQSRERTFRILISDPVKVVILGAYARLRPGRP